MTEVFEKWGNLNTETGTEERQYEDTGSKPWSDTCTSQEILEIATITRQEEEAKKDCPPSFGGSPALPTP